MKPKQKSRNSRTQNTSVVQSTNVQPLTSWVVFFIWAIIVGGIGGFLMTFAPATGYPELSIVGLVILCASFIFDILAFKALMSESHIRALEVFYGRPRAVVRTPNNKSDERYYDWDE